MPLDFDERADISDSELDDLKELIPKWISVKERLPNHNEQCLIYIKGGVVTAQVTIARLFKDSKWFVDDCWDNELVSRYTTHWMPLPPAPESDSCKE